MGNGKSLEEIFWRNGRFVDINNNEVNVKAVGHPALINYNADVKDKVEVRRITKEKISEGFLEYYLNVSSIDMEEVKAYVIGSGIKVGLKSNCKLHRPVQLYKKQ